MASVMQDTHFRPFYFSNSEKKKKAVLNGDKAVALHGANHILGRLQGCIQQGEGRGCPLSALVVTLLTVQVQFELLNTGH